MQDVSLPTWAALDPLVVERLKAQGILAEVFSSAAYYLNIPSSEQRHILLAAGVDDIHAAVAHAAFLRGNNNEQD